MYLQISKKQLFAAMNCMFKKELEEFGQNENMINHGIDASLVKILKKKRDLQDDSDLNDDDKEIIKQQYQNLRASENVFHIFELLRHCGDVTTVAKVFDLLVNECHQPSDTDKDKVHKEILRPLHQKPELKAWVIRELNRGEAGWCQTHCLSLNESWLNFQRYFIPQAFSSMKLVSFHLDYWKDLVIFGALRYYFTSERVRIQHLDRGVLPEYLRSTLFLYFSDLSKIS